MSGEREDKGWRATPRPLRKAPTGSAEPLHRVFAAVTWQALPFRKSLCSVGSGLVPYCPGNEASGYARRP